MSIYFFNFIYLFLGPGVFVAVPGVSLVAVSMVYSLDLALGLLTAVTSLAAEPRL